MLGKLFKYDFKSVNKLMLPLSFGIIVVTLIGAVMGKLSNIMAANNLTASFDMVFGIAIFALIAYPVFNFILLLKRYYDNFFSDEGYLTFTLPVKTHELIISKLLNSFVWTVITAIVTAVGTVIIACFSSEKFFNPKFIEEFVGLFDSMTVTDVIIAGLLAVTFVIFEYLLLFFVITTGAIISKKHKILTAFGLYYGISSLISIINVIYEATILENVFEDADTMLSFRLMGISEIIFMLIFAAVEFILLHHFLKDKLNIA